MPKRELDRWAYIDRYLLGLDTVPYNPQDASPQGEHQTVMVEGVEKILKGLGNIERIKRERGKKMY